MSIQVINTGSSPNSGDGDSLRSAFYKINNNFSYVLNSLTNIITTTTGIGYGFENNFPYYSQSGKVITGTNILNFIGFTNTLRIGNSFNSTTNFLHVKENYDNTFPNGVTFAQSHNVPDANNFVFYRSRGRYATPAPLLTGDEIADIIFVSINHEGTYTSAVGLTVSVENTSTEFPAGLLKFMVNNGSTLGATEVANLTSSGTWKVNYLDSFTTGTSLIVKNNLLPSENITFNLGNTSTQWNELHTRIGYFGANQSNIAYTNPLAIFTGNANNFTQIAIQNLNTGTSASSDIVATANDGTDELFYIDMGINNSNYSDVSWTVSGPHDGYLYVSNGNLTVGTTEPETYVKIHIGGTLDNNVVATFREPGTDSTSSFTGALTIDGGVGITGQLHLQETLHIGDQAINLPDAVFIGTRNVNSYVQLSVQNQNAGTNASSDFIATSNNGNDTSKYIDLGINSSGYNNPAWTISGPDDGYLYINSGNLTIGTDTTGTNLKIHIGGNLAENIVATFEENTLTLAQHVLPAANLTYDLGSTSSQWRSLYVGTSTIYLGGTALSVSSGTITLDGNPVSGGGATSTLTAGTATLSINTLSETILPSGLVFTPIENYGFGFGGTFASQTYGEQLQVLATGTGAFGLFGWGEVIGGPGGVAYVVGNQDGTNEVKVVAGSYTTTVHTWTFTNNSALTFPNGSTLGPEGIGAFGISNGTSGSPVYIVNKNIDGNHLADIVLTAGDGISGEIAFNIWNTLTSSVKTLAIDSSANLSVPGVIYNNDPSNVGQLLLAGDAGEPATYLALPSDIGSTSSFNVRLVNSNGSVQLTAGNNKNWLFNNNGDVIFPDGTTQTTAFNFLDNIPASSTSTGIKGQIAVSTASMYICVATNSWLRFDGVTF